MKGRTGRPQLAAARRKVTALSMPEELLERVDAYAAAERLLVVKTGNPNRSLAVRELLEHALDLYDRRLVAETKRRNER